MKKQIVVIGLGRFGGEVATALHHLGHDVLAIDKEEKNVMNVASHLTRAIQADVTDEAMARELGIRDFDVAIVAMGEAVESSVLITILLKKMGVRYIIARADNELHGTILEKIGADKVVYPERETAIKLAHSLTLSDVMEYIPVGENYGVVKFKASTYLVGRTLDDIGFGPGGKKDIAVLIIQRGKAIIIHPTPDELIQESDVFVVAGGDDKIEELRLEVDKERKEK